MKKTFFDVLRTKLKWGNDSGIPARIAGKRKWKQIAPRRGNS